ncbi:DUF4153 domain-containing protein [Glycomyces tarimensis]
MSSPEVSPEASRPEDADQRPVATRVAHHPYSGPVYVGPPPPLEPGIPNTAWNRPESGAPQLILLLTAAVAVFAGWAAFHTEGVGIGLALTGIGTIVVPMLAGGREWLGVRLPGAALVACLWSVAAIRDAGWIVALCSLAAVLLTPLVLSPPSRFTGAMWAFLGYLEGLADAFRWANGGIRRPSKGANTMRNLRVAGITAGLLAVFGGLFAAADSSFAALLTGLVPEIDAVSLVLRSMLALFVFPTVLLWVYVAVAKPRFDPEAPPEPKAASRFEIAVPLGALNLLFIAFIALQARVLYGGDDYVMATAGLTMAEYARSGFWQLSVVAVLALAVIAVAAWKAPRRRRGDRWAVRILLGGLGVMSLAVVASAMFRMSRYFEAFGLTRMRVWVFTVEIWLAVLFVLVLLCCWKLRATWLPRAILGSGAAVLLGLAAVNPDGLIARYNVEQFGGTEQFDLPYASGLSADAAEALSGLEGEQRDCVLALSGWTGGGDRPGLAWNLGSARAGQVDFGEPGECEGYAGLGDEFDSSLLEPGGASGSGAEFFSADSCEWIDLSGAGELFGSAEEGIEADPASQFGEFVGPDDPEGEAPYASLDCGYFGPATGYLMLEVRQWSDWSRAEEALVHERTEAERDGYTTAALGSETMAGFTAALDEDGRSGYTYMFAVDDVTYAAKLGGAPVDASAPAICEDLTSQMVEIYSEFA